MRGAAPVGLTMSLRVGTGAMIRTSGNDSERFNSFVISLRRTYLNNEPANFSHVANIVARRVVALRDQIAELKAEHKAALSGRVEINGFDHRQIFEAWLHGHMFHDDDPVKRTRWQEIANDAILSPIAHMVIEATAIQLAGLVLALDNIVAELLGEPPLPTNQAPPAVPLRELEHANSGMEVQIRRHFQRHSLWIDFVNTGNTEIRNVTLDEFLPLDDGDEEVLVHGERERNFPAERLRPRERVSLMAAPTFGTSLRWRVVVSWEDPVGVRLSDDFRLDLGSA